MQRRILQRKGIRLLYYSGYAVLGLCGLLLVCMFCPMVRETYADEASTSYNSSDVTAQNESGTTSRVWVRPTLAVAIEPYVNVEIVPKSTGSFSTWTTNLSVATNSRNGLTVLMSAVDGTELKSNDINNDRTISPIEADAMPSNFGANTWGYYVGKAEPNQTSVYSPLTDSATEAFSTSSSAAEQDYKVAFGAMIDTTLPTGLYQNSVMISVVANPNEAVSLNDLYYMQDIKPEICAGSKIWESTADEKQLVDSRDGKTYWVARLADGKCWMQQNLDLELDVDSDGDAVAVAKNGATTKLTSGNTDIAAETWNTNDNDVFVPSKILTIAPSTAEQNDDITYSWDAGEIVLTNPTGAQLCKSGTVVAVYAGQQLSTLPTTNCPTYTKDVTNMSPTYTAAPVSQPTQSVSSDNKSYDAHYLFGNWYSWSAATAGSAKTLSGSTASASICPKGWRLPTGTTTGELTTMFKQYGADSDIAKASTAPIYGVRNGAPYPKYGDLRDIGRRGYIWANSSSNGNARLILFDISEGLSVGGSTWYTGISVRCIAE